jgi:IclR family mhp operon transcriptional activator
MPSYTPVTAVLRGLEVLRVVNRSGVATVKEIHYETGLDKATIVRMLETLIHAGYLQRSDKTSAYNVTGRVLQLSAGFVRYDKAGEICAPILARLRDNIGWPAGFTMLDDDAMIVVETSRDDGPISFRRNPGYRLPILQVSVGKVYLAYCPEAERELILARVRDRPDADQKLSASRIEKMLKQVRKLGFAVSDESYIYREYRGNFIGMAVPVMNEGSVYGALNFIFVRNAITVEDAATRYIGNLQSAAEEIARAFRAEGL